MLDILIHLGHIVHMNVQTFVDSTLQSLLKRPEMWGGSEALELQTLLLLEIRAISQEQKPVREMYLSFLRNRFPDIGPLPLWNYLKKHQREAELIPLLTEFVTLLENK